MIQSLENHLELPYKHKDKPKFYLIILYLCAFLRQICLCSSIDMLISALFIIITKTGSNSISIKNTIVIHTKKHNTIIKNDQKMKNIGWFSIVSQGIKRVIKNVSYIHLYKVEKKNRQNFKKSWKWQR